MKKIFQFITFNLTFIQAYAQLDRGNTTTDLEALPKLEITEASKIKLKKNIFFNWSSFKTIDGGTYVSRDVYFPMEQLGKNDSNIIIHNHEDSQSRDILSFALSSHEVTNYEYRMFVNWVKDYAARTILSKVDSNYLITGTQLLKRSTTIDWENPLLRDSLFFEPSLRFDSTWSFNAWMLTYTIPKERNHLSAYSPKMLDAYHQNDNFSTYLPDTLIHVYPDTLAWIRDFGYSINGPLTHNYFWHPHYDRYPVVGLDWFQAKAYCLWLSYRLAEEIFQSTYGYVYDGYLEENDSLFFELVAKYQIPQFRLPSEQELTWAMLSGVKHENQNQKKIKTQIDLRSEAFLEKWYRNLSMTEWAHNFGEILDETGLLIKSYEEDGHLYSCMVKEYKPDANGIYNLHGNVAEWTESDVNSINVFGIELSDDTSTAVNKIVGIMNPRGFRSDSSNVSDIKFVYGTLTANRGTIPFRRIELKLSSIHHNLKLMDQISNGKIVKGGSWAQGLRYVLPHTSELYSPSEQHSFIGFRVAASRNPFNGKKSCYRYQD